MMWGVKAPLIPFVGLNVFVTYYIYKELNIMFKEFDHFFQGCIFQESYDNDNTSGTSDFNDVSHCEPDDCYCESMIRTNQVYFSGDIKKIDVKMIVTGTEPRKPRPTQESVLPTKERNKLNDSDFGIPETRSYPLHDKSHVEAAVRMFPNAPLKYRKSLAKRILRKAHEFNMDTSNWESLNKYMGSD